MSQRGFLGVDIFFVLSGFLITSLLAQERERNGVISLKRFYIRRSLRILPLYYVVLAILASYSAWKGSTSGHGQRFLNELPSHAAFVSNWVPVETLAVTWSLSTEEQFYLLWPPLFALLGRHAFWFLLLMFVPNQLVNLGAADAWLNAVGLRPESREILQATFTPIILGCLLALCLRHPAFEPCVKALASPLTIALLFAAWLAIVNLPGDVRGWPRLSFHAVTTLLLGAIALQPRHPLTRILDLRVLTAIGAISYGMYLLHIIIRDPIVRALQWVGTESALLLFIGCFVGTALAATVSYIVLERPLLRLKERFR